MRIVMARGVMAGGVTARGMTARGAMACGILLSLAACGSRQPLALGEGQQLPPAPYGRVVRPTPNELLDTPPLAIPQRSVELRTRSEKREDDPFDLPPPETAD